MSNDKVTLEEATQAVVKAALQAKQSLLELQNNHPDVFTNIFDT